MTALDDQITALTAEVARNATVEASALALIQGIPKLIADAVAKATAAGATPAQLASFTTLTSSLAAKDTELAAAVGANIVAPPVGP